MGPVFQSTLAALVRCQASNYKSNTHGPERDVQEFENLAWAWF